MFFRSFVRSHPDFVRLSEDRDHLNDRVADLTHRLSVQAEQISTLLQQKTELQAKLSERAQPVEDDRSEEIRTTIRQLWGDNPRAYQLATLGVSMARQRGEKPDQILKRIQSGIQVD